MEKYQIYGVRHNKDGSTAVVDLALCNDIVTTKYVLNGIHRELAANPGVANISWLNVASKEVPNIRPERADKLEELLLKAKGDLEALVAENDKLKELNEARVCNSCANGNSEGKGPSPELVKRLEAKIAELVADKKDLTEEVEAFDEACHKLRKQNEAFEKENERLRSIDPADIPAQLENEVREAREAKAMFVERSKQCERLIEENKRLKARSSEENVKMLVEEINKLKSNIDKFKEEKEGLITEVINLKQMNDKPPAYVDVVKENRELKKEVENCNKTIEEQLEENNTLSEINKKLHKKVEAAVGETVEEAGKTVELLEVIKGKDKEITALIEQTTPPDIQVLRKENANLLVDKGSLSKTNENLRDENRALQQKISELIGRENPYLTEEYKKELEEQYPTVDPDKRVRFLAESAERARVENEELKIKLSALKLEYEEYQKVVSVDEQTAKYDILLKDRDNVLKVSHNLEVERDQLKKELKKQQVAKTSDRETPTPAAKAPDNSIQIQGAMVEGLVDQLRKIVRFDNPETKAFVTMYPQYIPWIYDAFNIIHETFTEDNLEVVHVDRMIENGGNIKGLRIFINPFVPNNENELLAVVNDRWNKLIPQSYRQNFSIEIGTPNA